MSKIFELFGYPISDQSEQAADSRRRAWCPFMDASCDGGGNREMSAIDLVQKPQLASHFPGLSKAQSGVCSLSLREGDRPWIVCPRRLLALKSSSPSPWQKWIRDEVMRIAALPSGDLVDVRSEVKIKLGGSKKELAKQKPADVALADEPGTDSVFDYTFDYVITGRQSVPIAEAAEICRLSPKRTERDAEANGLTLRRHEGDLWIDDFPGDPIFIVEIMTSSTSGSNKSSRS